MSKKFNGVLRCFRSLFQPQQIVIRQLDVWRDVTAHKIRANKHFDKSAMPRFVDATLRWIQSYKYFLYSLCVLVLVTIIVTIIVLVQVLVLLLVPELPLWLLLKLQIHLLLKQLIEQLIIAVAAVRVTDRAAPTVTARYAARETARSKNSSSTSNNT